MKAERWVIRLAAACFIFSFVLPAAQLGPPEDRPALGCMAALFSAFVLPLAGRAATRGEANMGYSLAAGVYFTIAWMANVAMLYVLTVAPRGDERRQKRARRLAVAAALLVWGALLVDYRRLYAALGLGGEVELYAGYYLWALSFALAAVALIRRARARPSGTSGSLPGPAEGGETGEVG